MGHKDIRDGGPPRKPGFRPEDVVGLPVRQALVDLGHEGFDAETASANEAHPVLGIWVSNRVRLGVEDGVVTSVRIG